MRRIMPVLLTIILYFCEGVASALPVIFSDPYGGPNNPGSSNGDVIGALKSFDIESLTFTTLSTSLVTAEIRFNYNNGAATLADFAFAGVTLSVGDLLFSVNGHPAYGVALVNHDGFIAGDLYSVTAFRSSDSYLGGSGLVWRHGKPVRMDPSGSALVGAGSVVNSNLTFAEVLSTISFDPNDGFYSDLTTYGMDVSFASAVCANDIIEGHLVPEPSSWLLFTSAVAILVAAGGLRKGFPVLPK